MENQLSFFDLSDFFMRSRKESLRVVSIIFLDINVPFPPRF